MTSADPQSTHSPIEDYLDELLRRTRGDARSTRRLLEEAADHLYAAAADLEAGGMPRSEAETEAVRRFGSILAITRATARRGYAEFATGMMHATVTLFAWALVSAGVSGVLALIMIAFFGSEFVGSVDLFPFSGWSIGTIAWGTVILRVALGVLGLLALHADRVRQRRASRPATPPTGMIDTVAALGFAVATAVLTYACVAQAVQNSPTMIGYPLSGALATLAATAYFVRRAARRALGSNDPALSA